MLSKWNFHLPLRLEFGRLKAKQLDKLIAGLQDGKDTWACGRAMLVGYQNCPALDKDYDRAAESLAAIGSQVEVFREVVPEPDERTIADAARIARQRNVDFVVGFGGGSVIDTAKGIAALAVDDGPLWAHATANADSRPIERALPIIAVPTTAGTGAEATSVAVFRQQVPVATPDEPIKAIVYGRALLPKLAVVDPAFMDTMPAETAAACGADAFSHSIEVATSRLANPICSAMAAESLRLLLHNLETAIGLKNGCSVKEIQKAREAATLATTLSGMAVNGPGVTAAHAVSHALGALLHVPHGKAVALAAIPFLRYNAEACLESYAYLARACGLQHGDTECIGSDEALADVFVERIDRLWTSLGLPRRLEDSDAAGREELAGRIARNTMDGTPLAFRNNARKIDRESLQRIIAEIV